MQRVFSYFKRTSIFIVLLPACLILSVGQASADSSVWKVSKGDDHIFLGGTIHVLSKADYPLPEEFSEAYSASDLVVFETDIEAMTEPATIQKMLSKTSYSDGSTIRDHLKPETIEAIESHLQQRNMNLDMFASFKPTMLYLVLTTMELQLIGIDAQGVDSFYSAKASNDNKEQLMLETVDEQIDYISNMGIEDPDSLFEYGLPDIAELGTTMESMTRAWREGDADSLDDQMVELMAEDYPKMYKSLIIDRNMNWMPDITQYFETGDIEFVMVGAGHLVGEEGLLEILKREGYLVEQL